MFDFDRLFRALISTHRGEQSLNANLNLNQNHNLNQDQTQPRPQPHHHHHHHRGYSEPAKITGWHARHRTLSLTAQMPESIELPRTPTSSKFNRDTGFPEPLSPCCLPPPPKNSKPAADFPDRNTTLPHPDADTSPNASIEARDVDPARTRARYSLHYDRNSNGSNGKVIVDTSHLYDNIQYADGTKEAKSEEEIEKEVQMRDDLVDPPANGTVKVEIPDNLIPSEARSSSESGEKRRGFLGRLHSHRHRSQGSRG